MTSLNKKIKIAAVGMFLVSLAWLGIFADIPTEYYTTINNNNNNNNNNRRLTLSMPSKKPTLTEARLDKFIVIPEFKLLFCSIDQVGSTMFHKLFRDLRLLRANLTMDEARFQAKQTVFNKNTPKVHGWNNKSDLEDLLVNPEWTKAVFYRDPDDRFVSAYREHCEGDVGSTHCMAAFGIQNISFTGAVQVLQKNRTIMRQYNNNPHFDPMHTFCGGLNEQTIPYYDVIEKLDHRTSELRIKKLLQRLKVPKKIIELLIRYDVNTRGIQNVKGTTMYDLITGLWGGIVPEGGVKPGMRMYTKKSTKSYFKDKKIVPILKDYFATDYQLIHDYLLPASKESMRSMQREKLKADLLRAKEMASQFLVVQDPIVVVVDEKTKKIAFQLLKNPIVDDKAKAFAKELIQNPTIDELTRNMAKDLMHDPMVDEKARRIAKDILLESNDNTNDEEKGSAITMDNSLKDHPLINNPIVPGVPLLRKQ